eukprot:TRINITY_DN50795_c0_g1_i1.p1 TRINITY_DN50795_c0_g1~~TRINITY_DN50795_c0_g1_i1.p1  ORF type:complete len:398 (-),score=68.81 TRINITY_DN50795_c0_g1_i1:120-1313(-)
MAGSSQSVDTAAAVGTLQGLRVVELATVLAAPSATAVLADYGAEVIKIESPGGDMWRKEGMVLKGDSHGVMFDNTNRGKKSVVLDIKQAADMGLLRSLLQTADVFVTNVRQSALVKQKLDYEALRAEYPHLIYAHLTGWGRSGPGAERPGYDVGAWWASSGIMDFVRSTEAAPPPRYLAGMGDLTTASQLLAGIGMALFHRERSGKGQLVDVALMRSGLYVAGCQLTMAATRPKDFPPEKNVARADRSGVYNPAMNNYRTKDGKYLQLVGVEMKRHLPNILKVLGLERIMPELKNYPKSRKLIIAEMDRAFAEKTEQEWTDLFDASDVWYTRVKRLEDMLQDEQALAVNAFVQLPDMTTKIMAPPVQLSNLPSVPSRRAPKLGEHSEEVLGPLRSKL